MSDIRMVALDIDGTVLTSRGEVSSRVQCAIGRALQLGIFVTLATGRNWRHALPVANRLGIEGPLVVSNGSLVRAPGSPVALDCRPLDRTVAVAAVKLLTRWSFAPLVSTCDTEGPNLFYEQAPTLIQPGQILGRAPHDVRQVYDLAGLAGTTEPLKVMTLGRYESIATLANRLRREFREKAQITATQEANDCGLLEVSAPGVSKASGLARLADLYGIRPDEVVAFGDNFNDLEMLKWAGIGVAMGNAPDAVKAVADTVTLSNDEDGVAWFLERLGLQVA